jgi:hypothetical protein
MTLFPRHGSFILFLRRISHWLVISLAFFFPLESQWSMTESHAVLGRQLPPSTQEMSTLDHNLGKTGTDGRHSVNASLSMPIPGTVLQVDQQLPPIIKMHTSDYDLEKSSDSDEKASASIPISETEKLDIEHVPVQNDPRKWSSFRKVRAP